MTTYWRMYVREFDSKTMGRTGPEIFFPKSGCQAQPNNEREAMRFSTADALRTVKDAANTLWRNEATIQCVSENGADDLPKKYAAVTIDMQNEIIKDLRNELAVATRTVARQENDIVERGAEVTNLRETVARLEGSRSWQSLAAPLHIIEVRTDRNGSYQRQGVVKVVAETSAGNILIEGPGAAFDQAALWNTFQSGRLAYLGDEGQPGAALRKERDDLKTDNSRLAAERNQWCARAVQAEEVLAVQKQIVARRTAERNSADKSAQTLEDGICNVIGSTKWLTEADRIAELCTHVVLLRTNLREAMDKNELLHRHASNAEALQRQAVTERDQARTACQDTINELKSRLARCFDGAR